MIAAAFTLLRAVPLTAWLVAGVLTLAGAYHLYATNAAYRAGSAAATKTITDANAKSKEKADEGIQNVDDCFAAGGAWRRRDGVCLRASQ